MRSYQARQSSALRAEKKIRGAPFPGACSLRDPRPWQPSLALRAKGSEKPNHASMAARPQPSERAAGDQTVDDAAEDELFEVDDVIELSILIDG